MQRDKLCYGGFLQSKVIARDGKLVLNDKTASRGGGG